MSPSCRSLSSTSTCYEYDSTQRRTSSKCRGTRGNTTSNERDSDKNNNLKGDKGLTIQRIIHKKMHNNLSSKPKENIPRHSSPSKSGHRKLNFIVILNPTLIKVNQQREIPLPEAPSQPLYNSMNFIIWNCRGGSGANIRHNFRSLLDWHRPPIVALLETKMQDHQPLLDDLNFNNMIQVPTVGNSEGIILLWEDSQLDMDEITTTNQEIHVMVKVSTTNCSWLLSCIYAHVHLNQCLILWENLRKTKNNLKISD